MAVSRNPDYVAPQWISYRTRMVNRLSVPLRYEYA
jgi:hypothetical protein